MDRLINEWMDGWMDGRMDGQTVFLTEYPVSLPKSKMEVKWLLNINPCCLLSQLEFNTLSVHVW